MTYRVLSLALVSTLGCASSAPAPAQPCPAPGEPSDATAAPAAPAAAPTAPAPVADPPPANARKQVCTQPEHGQFDFWIGEWDVRTPAGDLAGHNRIERVYAGCAVLEHWRSASGGGGTSTNYFDPEKKAWVQNWVDGTGAVIQLEGGIAGDAMVLDGRYVQIDGTVSRMRGTWTPLPNGHVRQLFETSTDGGATWTVWFDGDYGPAGA